MSSIDPRAAQKIQRELVSGESVCWAGMPDPGVIFHTDDWAAIPFSLIWTGFFVFWEAGALGYWDDFSTSNHGSTFMALWGIPFLLIGNYLVWGRFLVDAWLKRRTYYALTNRRVLVLQEGWTRKTSTMFIGEIPKIEREGDRVGTLWFGPKHPLIGPRRARKRSMSRFSVDDVPVFADIDNVDSVYRLVTDLRGKEGAKSTERQQPLTYNS